MKEVEELTIWCHDNHLSLNVSKAKENPIPTSTNESYVKIADHFRFLGTRISGPLTWSLNTNCVLRKAT